MLTTTSVEASEVDSMAQQILVCNGCCCGRVERGNNEVPIDALRQAWGELELSAHVKLTVSSCMGPCSMNNVALVKTDNERIWLGKLNAQEDYEALIDLAHGLAQGDGRIQLPERLNVRRFTPKSN